MKYGLPFDGCVVGEYPHGSVTQWFGENPDLYKKICAVRDNCLTGGHNGLDLVAPHGTPIKAVSDQTVSNVRHDEKGYGKHIRCLDGTYEWTYGHLHEIFVTQGQKVKKGDVIGTMGNTGFVVSGATPYWKHNPYAGTHLHITARKYEERNGTPYILDWENGFLGAVNTVHLFTLPEFSDNPIVVTPEKDEPELVTSESSSESGEVFITDADDLVQTWDHLTLFSVVNNLKSLLTPMGMKSIAKGKMTYAAAVAAIAFGVIGLIFGYVDSATAIQTVIAGLAAFGVRRKMDNYE